MIKVSSELAGALVAFINPVNNEVVAAAVVSLDGSINVKVPKGTYKLIVAKKGYHVYEETVIISEDTSINVALSEITLPITETPSAVIRKASASESIPSTALSETPSVTVT